MKTVSPVAAFSIDEMPGFELAKIHMQWLKDLTKHDSP
jgi:hypothetical protein